MSTKGFAYVSKELAQRLEDAQQPVTRGKGQRIVSDQEEVELLIVSMDTVWARYLQGRMEDRAAARAYDAMLRRWGVSTEPYNPDEE